MAQKINKNEENDMFTIVQQNEVFVKKLAFPDFLYLSVLGYESTSVASTTKRSSFVANELQVARTSFGVSC